MWAWMHVSGRLFRFLNAIAGPQGGLRPVVVRNLFLQKGLDARLQISTPAGG